MLWLATIAKRNTMQPSYQRRVHVSNSLVTLGMQTAYDSLMMVLRMFLTKATHWLADIHSHVHGKLHENRLTYAAALRQLPYCGWRKSNVKPSCSLCKYDKRPTWGLCKECVSFTWIDGFTCSPEVALMWGCAAFMGPSCSLHVDIM